jgi:thiol-disulfide isomerase/thioredoxin/type III secretion system FlhB-like substrate exporter
MKTVHCMLALSLAAGLVCLTSCDGASAAPKQADQAAAKAKVDEKDDTKADDPKQDDKAAAKNRYELPKGGVKELLAFIKNVREFSLSNAEEENEHGEKALLAIKSAAEKIIKIAKPEDKKLEGYDDIPGLLLAIRAMQIGDTKPDEQRKLIADIKAYFQGRDKITRQDASIAMQAASGLEYNAPEVAAEAYRELGEALAKSNDEQLARVGKKMEGAARRLTLVGQPLEVTGTEMDGAKFDWAKYRGKVVLVDFWATWCGPCRAEVPNVLKNYKLYHDRGFDVVGISLDDDREALEKFLEKEKNPWLTLHDGGWDDNPTAGYYGVMGIPTVILVDKEGKVVSTNARGPELSKLLEGLLGPAKPGDDKPGDK